MLGAGQEMKKTEKLTESLLALGLAGPSARVSQTQVGGDREAE